MLMARLCRPRLYLLCFFFFSSRRRHTRFDCDWSSDVCSSDLAQQPDQEFRRGRGRGYADAAALCALAHPDRKSTRLNSSHSQISYAVFCLKKKKAQKLTPDQDYYTHSHLIAQILVSQSELRVESHLD